MGLNDVIMLVLILILAPTLINYFGKSIDPRYKKHLVYLWYYHLLFGLIYIFYVTNFGGDAKGYWQDHGKPLSFYLEMGPGTTFMHVFNYPFVHVLKLAFFTGSILYSFFGFLGTMFFYLSTLHLVKSNNIKIAGYSLFPWMFFLPNLHFWSAGVGKDTLSFMCVGLFLFCVLKPANRILGILLSLFLIYFVRPHMAIFLLASFGMGVLLDKGLKTIYKLILMTAFFAAVLVLFDDVMEYVKLDEVSTESIEEYSDKKVHLLSRSSRTGSSIDVTSYPLPLKVFTFLFRPLFFDAHNITSLMASVENLILLILTYKLFKASPFASFKEAPFQIKGLILFVLIGSVGFSNILGNLGIMVRMKNMFTPTFLIFIYWVLSYQKNLNTKEENAIARVTSRRNLRLVGPKLENNS